MRVLALGLSSSLLFSFVFIIFLSGTYAYNIYSDIEKVETILMAIVKYGLAVSFGFLVNKVWGVMHEDIDR
uniref:Uncharacterized protein n=1 Tax=Candidatus Kentrum eta TaxID=2126337 RepID=A0A450UXS3_9GAMM|nr:MAG: hypothetical protein BECKH772A_GA0070896_1001511 [Candidatus Kentron sp. H]VFJ91000.1 MAG: hypothetical protein BECKH772B_GA0070898_1001311 [Candidatus Kentron sp. H]VFJ97319.1 MAG: hypothetical protein BECKH772C_GA0070978_1001211 [Candidatus Kentron sp. H]